MCGAGALQRGCSQRGDSGGTETSSAEAVRPIWTVVPGETSHDLVSRYYTAVFSSSHVVLELSYIFSLCARILNHSLFFSVFFHHLIIIPTIYYHFSIHRLQLCFFLKSLIFEVQSPFLLRFTKISSFERFEKWEIIF